MAPKTHTVSAREFKNHCLRLMDEVSRHGVSITITKRGLPLVRIVPMRDPGEMRSLDGTIVRADKTIYSTGEPFNADE